MDDVRGLTLIEIILFMRVTLFELKKNTILYKKYSFISYNIICIIGTWQEYV